MKAFAIVPAAVAAILALNISAASSQAACQKEYQACMDGCGSRSSKSLQDSCFTSCEGQNNMCAERVYGKRPLNASPAIAAAPSDQAKEAQAKVAPAKDAQEKPESKPEQEPARAAAPERAQASEKPAATRRRVR